MLHENSIDLIVVEVHEMPVDDARRLCLRSIRSEWLSSLRWRFNPKQAEAGAR